MNGNHTSQVDRVGKGHKSMGVTQQTQPAPRMETAILALQWNCRGLKSKLPELREYLRTHFVPILALAEGVLPAETSLAGYRAYNNANIPSFPRGSAALYIHKSVPQVEEDLTLYCTTSSEVVGATVNIRNQQITVLSIYVRHTKKNEVFDADVLQRLRHRFRGHLLVCGDFNAHHPSWGTGSTDTRGKNVARVIQASDLVLANDGSPTFTDHTHETAIDLTLHSPELKITWNIEADTWGSDHFPILIHAGRKACGKEERRVTVWDTFRAALGTTNDIVDDIRTALGRATLSTSSPRHYPPPDLKFLNLRAARRRAQRRLRRHNTPQNKTDYNRISAVLRRHVRWQRTNNWKAFTATLDAHTPTTKIWKITKSMMGEARGKQPYEDIALSTGRSVQEIANSFAEVMYIDCEAPSASKLQVHPADLAPNDLNLPLTRQELEYVLRTCNKKSCPGPDGISYQALQNLTPSALDRLLQLYNEVWDSGEVPKEWLRTHVVPILKHGKPKVDLQSYRPIALTSAVLKTYEKLIQQRLNWYLEEHNILPPQIIGFRNRLSTSDILLNLVSSIDEARAEHSRTLAVFFDIKQAYDNIVFRTVASSLAEIGIQGKMYASIMNLITQREVQVKLGPHCSNTKYPRKGLPQGSVLSPILFNIVLAKLPPAVLTSSPAVQLSIYADDISIWVTGNDKRTLEREAQAAIDAISQYITSVGLAISEEKSAAMLFQKRFRKRQIPHITLNGHKITFTKDHTLLGLTLDHKARWRKQIDIVASRCEHILNVLKRLCGTAWGSSPKSMLTLWDSLAVSKILCILPYAQPSQTQIERINRIHRRGLRLAIGVPAGTTNDSLYTECSTLPIQLQVTERLLCQINRLYTTSSGTKIVNQIAQRRHSRYNATLTTFHCVTSPPDTPDHREPPWQAQSVRTCQTVPGLTKKNDQNDTVIRQITQEFLEDHYHERLMIYTDGSTTEHSSAAAFTIPSQKLQWSGKLYRGTTSTHAELVAILQALRLLRTQQPANLVILTDSKASLIILEDQHHSQPSACKIRRLVTEMTRKGSAITFQWIPAHVGLKYNEEADRLARQAHTQDPSVAIATDVEDNKRVIRNYVWTFHPFRTTSSGILPSPIVSQRVCRKDATLLHRLRTNSAFTPAYLHKIHVVGSDECEDCNKTADIEHLVMTCDNFASERQVMLRTIQEGGMKRQDLHDILFPSGPVGRRRVVQDALLTYMHATGLYGRL